MKRILLLLYISSYGQDTLTVMTYNVLRFDGNSTSRAAYLKKTINYIKPDLIVLQEIEDQSGIDLLLNNILNADSTVFEAGPLPTNQYMKSGILYRSSTFDLTSSLSLATSLRDIPGYTLSIKNAHMNVSQFTIFGAHLKASQGEEAQRWEEAKVLYDHVKTQESDFHYILAGDLNLYDPGEPAYQLLLDSMTVDLEDPIGDWNRDDGSHVEKFTQSTRAVQLSDGGAPGGLDDRFDFILFSDHFTIKDPDLRYVEGSYQVIGNDGNHYNKSIIDGSNNAVPDSIAEAIYYGSDHYPVLAKIVYTAKTSTSPVAHGGGDITAAVGDSIFLDASKSYDPNGTITDYLWDQTSGPSVVINMAKSVKANFVVPEVNRTTVFTFKLSIIDNDGESATDFVNVVVKIIGGYTPFNIQYTENKGSGEDCYPSEFEGQNVEVTGVVTAVRPNQTYPNFFFQDATKEEWAGMFVYVPEDYGVPSVGDMVKLKGDVAEYYGMTEMKNIDVTEILSSNHLVEPITVNAASISGDCRIWVEKYEGMLVRLVNVNVTKSANSDGQWVVSDWSGSALIDGYLYGDNWLQPEYGTHFISITGVLHYTYGEYKLMPRGSQDFNDPVTAVGDELPERFALLRNYPNPFNSTTMIEFDIGKNIKAPIELDIIDISGRVVAHLISGIPNGNTVEWNGNNDIGEPMPGGIYFVRLISSSTVLTEKMVLLK